jgi:glutathionyl-hydroquinone reductase
MSTKGQFPAEQAESGEFVRQEDAFRDWISAEGSTRFPAEPGRYHLYISLACPWASRTLIARNVKGLRDWVGVTVVDPVRDEKGWRFCDGPGHSKDPINGFVYLSQAYEATDPEFEGRVTVPVLWDKVERRIVNNSEDDICRMFETVGKPDVKLFPVGLEEEQSELSKYIYEVINNGVYKAGFATKQEVYAKACRELFVGLERMEERLARNRFLLGRQIVEADWRLFLTLIRFDPVYYVHFKCNVRRIMDFPALQGYMLDLYQQPGIAETVNMDHIKRHYYITHDDINPTRIVPIGPEMDLQASHGRERL